MRAMITKSFALDCLYGIHDFRVDTFMIALFIPGAAIDFDTEVYEANNEILGAGYDQGGVPMVVNLEYPKIEGKSACVRFNYATWEGPATFSYRKALIYNATKGNRSVMAIDFGTDRGPENSGHRIFTPESALPLLTLSFG